MKTLHLSIIVIVISFSTCYAFAQYQTVQYGGPATNDLGNGSLLSIATTKSVFSAGDMIDIHGNSLPNYHVELTLIGP
ncbi:MAG: hypothetical protein KGI09_07205, partial [Thaumarchaeota archaeon]|nr:hypothetical protein [Nitrososphaerota archaeon]